MERRYDPVEGVWRLLAESSRLRGSSDDLDGCALCPPLRGSSGIEIRQSELDIAVVDDPFPPLEPTPPTPTPVPSLLYANAPSVGAAEVIVYCEQHGSSLARLGVPKIESLIHVWAARYAILGARPETEYVLIFENRGARTSEISHPHGRVYAYPEIPPRPLRKLQVARDYLDRHGCCVLCDVVTQEQAEAIRIVSVNESFVAFVPFAGRFPFEVHVAPRRHAASLIDLTDPERLSFALILERVLVAFDALFPSPAPYVMALHQAPTDDGIWQPVSHLQLELTPLAHDAELFTASRAAALAAGAFELGLAPEDAASQLRQALRP
jgi:UDPglucose--hexose-1-phosphate uridylyltransferase